MRALIRSSILALAIIVLTNWHFVANAQEKLDLHHILSIAKIAGACGIMDEMISFQSKTKLSGGNDFVSRFWFAESARQGFAVEEMSERCNKAIGLYDKLWKSGEK